MFTLFKNACVYSLSRDFTLNFDTLNEQLTACAFKTCTKHDMASTGWRALVEGGDRFYHVAGDNVLLVVRHEKKVIPPETIKSTVMMEVEKLEAEQSRKLKHAEKLTIKDEALHALIPRAFTKSSYIQLWIDLKKGRIVVDTASARTAEKALALLRKSLGSLPVAPMYPVNPPELIMTDWIKEQAVPTPFALNSVTTAKVESILEAGASTTFRKEPIGSSTLESSVADGRLVTSLDVAHNTDFRLSLTLKNDMTIAKIGYSDIFIQANDEIEGEEEETHAKTRKNADFILMCSTLGRVIEDAVAVFGGEAKP